jgi:hypothetical protein
MRTLQWFCFLGEVFTAACDFSSETDTTARHVAGGAAGASSLPSSSRAGAGQAGLAGSAAAAGASGGRSSSPTSGGQGGSAGGAAGAGPCSPNNEPDEPDPDGLDTNCDGVDGNALRDIYVDGANGDDKNSGDPTHPLKTIERGLALLSASSGAGGSGGSAGRGSGAAGGAAGALTHAGTAGAASTGGSVSATSTLRHILVTKGDYSPTTSIGNAEWAIVGGYTPTFDAPPKQELTRLLVDARGLVVQGNGLLQTLTVVAADGTQEAPTSHGIVAKDGVISLRDVSIEAGIGTDGTPGDSGALGDPGKVPDSTATPNGWNVAVCGGAISQLASGAPVGVANAEGQPAGVVNYSNPALSSPAGFGSPGRDGSSGANATGEGYYMNDQLYFSPGADGVKDATPGFGGPGGAEGNGNMNDCLYASKGATGGCPGGPGRGGGAGGGSVGLFVMRGQAKLQGVHITTKGGGAGTSGGDGGLGGNGGPAVAPKANAGALSWCGTFTLYTDGACQSDDYYRCAFWGGQAGKGGTGGPGGAGAGGWSVGVVGAAGVTVDIATTTFSLGNGGPGGVGPDGTRAAAGKRAPQSIGEVFYGTM